jgi:hypothetical protein
MLTADDFSEVYPGFVERAHSMVWCSFATVDSRNRPRTRVLHPIWDEGTGWVATNRSSLKGRHLACNPFVSLAYIADPLKPAYAECTASWEDDPTLKKYAWDLFKLAPPPLGYDPAVIWHTVKNPEFGLLKLLPYRITLGNLAAPGESRLWQGHPGVSVTAAPRARG